jgi:hypothetical protein
VIMSLAEISGHDTLWMFLHRWTPVLHCNECRVTSTAGMWVTFKVNHKVCRDHLVLVPALSSRRG